MLNDGFGVTKRERTNQTKTSTGHHSSLPGSRTEIIFARINFYHGATNPQHTTLSSITEAFNEAFSDYVIPLRFTDEGMAGKIRGEGISLRHSVGAFHNSRLVGFILHAVEERNGEPVIYNAGTGVLPAFRGKGITGQLYGYSLSLLAEEGIRRHLLEVIDSNGTAKKIYEAVGFRTVRKLVAYRSTAPVGHALPADIRPIVNLPSEAAFFSTTPSWQNSTASLLRDREGHQLAGAFDKDILVGYAAFVAATGRIKQMAVHGDYRRKGIGRTLLQHLQQQSPEGRLTVTNLDEAYEPANRFFRALGFQPILGLYEMAMQVSRVSYGVNQ